MLAALLLAAAVGAAGPKSTVALDRTDVHVGDRVVATYTLTIPAEARVEVESVVSPAPEVSGDAAAVNAAPSGSPAVNGAPSGAAADGTPPGGGTALEYFPLPAAVVEKGSRDSWTVKQPIPFASFVVGDLVIPGPNFILVTKDGQRTPFKGATVTLTVKSNLPGNKKPEELAIRADRAVRIPARGPWFWGSVVAASLLLVALIVWLVYRLKRKTAPGEARPPAMPAGAELLAALSRLETQVAVLGDDPRDFYTDLTHSVKRYLERSTGDPVLEWTTFETLRRLRERGFEIPREIGFAELLNAADFVKFAMGRATRDEAQRHIGNARLLHGHVEALLAVREKEEAAAAAAAAKAAPAVAEARPPRVARRAS